MHHQVLGSLVPARNRDDAFEAHVQYQGRDIAIDIDPDGEDIEAVLAFAVEVVRSLEDLDARARAIASRDLLETYNGDWRSNLQVLDDGSRWTVHDPELSDSEFRARLILSGVNVLGSTSIDVWFEDDGMFMGHSVYIRSSDGIDVSQATAALYG